MILTECTDTLLPGWLATVNGHLFRAVKKKKKKHERKKKTANLKVTCWNVRIMKDSEDHPQRRSALVARELARLDIALTLIL